MQISQRASNITQSPIRAMTKECKNVNGINMAQGVCDLDIPDTITYSAKKAIDMGFNVYMPCEGDDSLRQAVAEKYQKDYNMTIDYDRQVIISAGATGAFYAVCMALFNPGDEVILLEPYYGYHCGTLQAMGCKPTFAKLAAPDWGLDMDALEKVVSPSTRALVLNTPGNPSGKVFTKAELENIGAFAAAHDLVVITDEIYEAFVYEKESHIPPASVPALADRTITISGFSKIFSITGWRLGYAICPPDIIRPVSHMNDLIYVCAPSPFQVAVCKGLLTLPPAYYQTIARDHQDKRDLLCGTLSEIGLTPAVPKGAYYVLADTAKVPGNDDYEKAMHILQKTGVASVPGRAFFHDDAGDNLVRFCFAKKMEVLKEACERLAALF